MTDTDLETRARAYAERMGERWEHMGPEGREAARRAVTAEGAAADFLALPVAEQPGSAVQGEPVAWTSQASMEMLHESGTAVMGALRTDYCNVPLYTTPPPAPAAEQGDALAEQFRKGWEAGRADALAQPEARGVEGLLSAMQEIQMAANGDYEPGGLQSLLPWLADVSGKALAPFATPNPVLAEQPEGKWKLVPAELTEAMRDAGAAEIGRPATATNRAHWAWEAMLAAAPAAPVGVDEAAADRIAHIIRDFDNGELSFDDLPRLITAALAGKAAP